MGGVLRVLQFFQRQICCDNQRLLAAVSAINHVVNLFKPVFRATLHAEIVKDKQREAAKAGYVLVPVLIAVLSSTLGAPDLSDIRQIK